MLCLFFNFNNRYICLCYKVPTQTRLFRDGQSSKPAFLGSQRQFVDHVEALITEPMVSTPGLYQWTVPQLSIMIIYNCTWSILIQQIRILLSADNLNQKIQKKAYFLFVINLITRSKQICRMGRSLKLWNYPLSYPERCLKEMQHHLYVLKCFIVVCV